MKLLRAGAEGGDPYSMWTYGHRLGAEGKTDQARQWLTKAAAAGEPNAADLLAAQGMIDSPDHRPRDLIPLFVKMGKRSRRYAVESLREIPRRR